ncbi:MAG TPA: hypothetical protein VFG46_13400 [Chryseolinea sp.]|nr:hypothetical protein [Chryseolinea sp.]
MMRYWFTILLWTFVTFVYGQQMHNLSKRLQHLEKQGDFKFDTTGFSSLPKFDYRCDDANAHRWDYFHVVDLNQDGLKDLIYSGPCSPNNQTGIFLNNGRAFKRIYDYPGKIVSIEKSESATVINILKEATPCEDYSQYTEVSVDLNSQVAKHTILFGPTTKITIGGRLKQEKVVGMIRTTPQVNDEVKRNECNTAVRKGNQLTRIEEFKNIVQLNKSGDWWLVLYQENGEKSWIGWMRLN